MAMHAASRDRSPPRPSMAAGPGLPAMRLRLTRQFAVAVVVLGLGGAAAAAEPPQGVAPTHAETMARLGYVRHGRAWCTPQEVELLERAEQAERLRLAWRTKLERLRRDLDEPGAAAAAAETIRGIADPAAVAPLAEALLAEPSVRVRTLYVEALSRVRSQDALASLVAVALDHGDSETRIAAVERLQGIGPHLAVAPLAAALSSPDNARVNRAAEALGRLGIASAVPPLITALETEHVTVVSDGRAAGSTSATFTPSGGGLSLGGGPKPVKVRLRNDRVLEALIALTGVNFQWDEAAWRAWLANERMLPPGYDPRRG